MSSKKRIIKFCVQLVSVAVLIIIDKIIKDIAVEKLYGRPLLTVIKGFIGLVYAENTGAAFSMFSASTNALSVVTGIALLGGLAAMFFVSGKGKIYDIAIPLIIAGGAGNLFDRLTRGYVVDYICTLFIDFPVFNFADILITCSCFAVIIYLIYEIVKDAKKDKTEKNRND